MHEPSEGMAVSTCWGVPWKASIAVHSSAFLKQASRPLEHILLVSRVELELKSAIASLDTMEAYDAL